MTRKELIEELLKVGTDETVVKSMCTADDINYDIAAVNFDFGNNIITLSEDEA